MYALARELASCRTYLVDQLLQKQDRLKARLMAQSESSCARDLSIKYVRSKPTRMMSRQTRGREEKWKSRYQNTRRRALIARTNGKQERSRAALCMRQRRRREARGMFFFFASEALTARVRARSTGEITSMAGKIEAIISVWAGWNKGSRPMI